MRTIWRISRLGSRTGRKGAPPLPPERPPHPRADMESVLTPVFIRRRRRDVRELYGDTAEIDGEPVRFPTPALSNVGLSAG